MHSFSSTSYFQTTVSSELADSNFKLLTPQWWKNTMHKRVNQLQKVDNVNHFLLHSLDAIISRLSDSKLIDILLQSKMLKIMEYKLLILPNTKFEHQQKDLKTNLLREDLSTVPKYQKCHKSSIIVEKSMSPSPNLTCSIQRTKTGFKMIEFNPQFLASHFNKKSHPFQRIIDNYILIVENQYMQKIKNTKPQKDSENFKKQLKNDFVLLSRFMKGAIEPYLRQIRQNSENWNLDRTKTISFMQRYILTHTKVTNSMRKIIRFYVRNCSNVIKVQQILPVFNRIQDFQIPQKFQIDGCYIRAMNSLMTFAQTSSPQKAIQQLSNFRKQIAEDIDEYYKTIGMQQYRQLGVESQLQIIKFIIFKLRDWLVQVFAQLQFLQLIYEEQVYVNFDESSYMFSQLSMVFQKMLQCHKQ